MITKNKIKKVYRWGGLSFPSSPCRNVLVWRWQLAGGKQVLEQVTSTWFPWKRRRQGASSWGTRWSSFVVFHSAVKRRAAAPKNKRRFQTAVRQRDKGIDRSGFKQDQIVEKSTLEVMRAGWNRLQNNTTMMLRRQRVSQTRFFSDVSQCFQAQASAARWHQVQPVQTPPRPPQRRAGQAHLPAALQRRGPGSAGQVVGAAPERGLPEGQELLQRWVSAQDSALASKPYFFKSQKWKRLSDWNATGGNGGSSQISLKSKIVEASLLSIHINEHQTHIRLSEPLSVAGV